MGYLKLLLLLMLVGVEAKAQVDSGDFQARRRAAMDKCPDGIVLLHSNFGLKRWEESGFRQDPNFYYFTGLINAQAILAIDGRERQSWLFVPPEERSLSGPFQGYNRVFLSPGKTTEGELNIEHVVQWGELIPFIESRRKVDSKLPIYLDSGGQTGAMMGRVSNPAGLAGVFNPHILWTDALRAKWPDLVVRDAFPILDEIRSVKSAGEIALLRKAAGVTADGFWTGVRSIGPGRTQRQVEGDVVRGCTEAGSDGASLWPWVRSGPYALGPALFTAFVDYHNLNRKMQVGELVRLDVGCDYEMYKGDFGRTIPVSGRFDEGQSETLDLLNGTYLAGLKVMKDGAPSSEVPKAAVEYIKEHQAGLKTPMAKKAAENALKQGSWALHGLGVDMAEGRPKVFRAGNVVCFEPLFTADDQAFFVEDTILITPTGYEIINPPLPYSPIDIEKAMAERKKSRQQNR